MICLFDLMNENTGLTQFLEFTNLRWNCPVQVTTVNIKTREILEKSNTAW